MSEQLKEEAFFDFLAVRETALAAAVGAIVMDNIPTARVQVIADTATDSIVQLAARVVLHQRSTGERTPSV